MKEENLWVSVKRVCQTTRSLEAEHNWVNKVQTLESSRQDQVWVADITYVRLKRRFISVARLMDIFTRMIRGWQVSYHLNTSLTLKPLQEARFESGSPEIHHSDQGAQYLSSAYLSTLKADGIQISLAHRGRPWENGYAERLIRTLKAEEGSPQCLRGYYRGSRTHRAVYHTGVSPETPTFGVRISNTSRISKTNLLLTLINCGPN